MAETPNDSQNPSGETGPSSQAEGSVPAEGEISLESIDSLLEAQDPHFRSRMEELGSIQVDVDLSGQSVDPDAVEPAPTTPEVVFSEAENSIGKKGLLHYARQGLLRLVRGFRYSIEEYRQTGIKALKTQAFNLLRWLKHLAVNSAHQLSEWLYWLRHLEGRQKFILLVAALLVAFAVQVARFAQTGHTLTVFQDRYLPSYMQVADKVEHFKSDEPFLDLFESANLPKYYVSLERLVVNLKVSEHSSPSPMGAFKFFIEGDSQEVIVEVKDREMEMRDLIQRKLEQFSYDELTSPQGKLRAKTAIREDLNRILNSGRVRKVLIDFLVLKP